MAKNDPKLVDARWIASYEAQLIDNTILVPGETVVQISRHEALVSENWEIVGGDTGPTSKELRAEAKAKDIAIPKGSKKPDVERLLAEHERAATEEPEEQTTEPEAPAEPPADETPDGSGD